MIGVNQILVRLITKGKRVEIDLLLNIGRQS